jgi:hypothetical protein
MVPKKSEIELIYVAKVIFNLYLYIRRMYKSGETPSVLRVHESIPKYIHRIEIKIGRFIAWSVSDWATDWSSEGNHVSTSC